jgi:hypothetical protein
MHLSHEVGLIFTSIYKFSRPCLLLSLCFLDGTKSLKNKSVLAVCRLYNREPDMLHSAHVWRHSIDNRGSYAVENAYKSKAVPQHTMDSLGEEI